MASGPVAAATDTDTDTDTATDTDTDTDTDTVTADADADNAYRRRSPLPTDDGIPTTGRLDRKPRHRAYAGPRPGIGGPVGHRRERQRGLHPHPSVDGTPGGATSIIRSSWHLSNVLAPLVLARGPAGTLVGTQAVLNLRAANTSGHGDEFQADRR